MKILKFLETYNQDRNLLEGYFDSLEKHEEIRTSFGRKVERIVYVDNRDYPVITINLDRVLSYKVAKLDKPKTYIDHSMLNFLTSMVDISQEDILEILKDFIEKDINKEIDPNISLTFLNI